MVEVNGHAEPGYEKVRDAFAANFDRYGDVGAAVTVYRHGRLVVDLWGGVRNGETGEPWKADTMVRVASTTKGLTAVCANLLAQQGQLDLDAPVVTYWPEFAAEGKESIPVRWLLGHKAGLPVVDRIFTADDVFAWDPICEALAAQRPIWEPGTAHGYHGQTYGYLVGEVIRRASGRTVGTYLADEVAAPLGLDTFIGLPEEMLRRTARVVSPAYGGPADQAEAQGVARRRALSNRMLPTSMPSTWPSCSGCTSSPTSGRTTTARNGYGSRCPRPTGSLPPDRWPSSTHRSSGKSMAFACSPPQPSPLPDHAKRTARTGSCAGYLATGSASSCHRPICR